MVDPKQALTKFSAVAAATVHMRDLGAPPPADRYGELATTLALGGALEESNRDLFSLLAAEFSITSVEEVLALAQLDQRDDLGLLRSVSLESETVARLAEMYSSTPAGASEVSDWRRYDNFEYATGLELDLSSPPTDSASVDLLQMGAEFGAPPPAVGSTNLIDAYMSGIRDQGNRGTCTAFAGIACLEYHVHRFQSRSGIDLSEQFAFWDMVEKTHRYNLQGMFATLRTSGSCSERTWPYYGNNVPGNDSQGPPPQQAPTEALGYRPSTVLQLSPRSVDQIKDAISRFHPVAVGIPVYKSWFDSAVVRKYGNITVPLPNETPEQIGHAIALVGFEDNAQFAGGGYFVVRNSWDKHWATDSVFSAGYGTIPYRYIANYNWDAWYVAG